MLTERRRKEIASLSQKKHRQRLGQTKVEGVRAVSGAVAAGAPVIELVVTHEAAMVPDVAQIIAASAGAVYRVDGRTMRRLTDVETSQGVLAIVATHLDSTESLRSRRRVLVLDGVSDPGNVGTLIRASAWFGVDAVLLGPGTADPFSPKVVRATMSALWETNLSQSPDLARTLGLLKDAGFTIYAAALTGIEATVWKPSVPSALVLGNEAHGITPGVLEAADDSVAIRGSAGAATDSLNVATAGAVLLYQWTR